MFEQKILTTEDQREWHETLNHFKVKDAYYLPEYLEIYEQEKGKAPFISFGGQGLLFYFGDSRNAVLYPFFKRSISNLSLGDENLKDIYDIISPYGYGGPLAIVENSANLEKLWRNYFLSFHIYCQKNRIVSEFCRLNPFFENEEPVSKYSNGTIKRVGQIVYVDLTVSEDRILAQMLKGHRRKIRKTESNPDLTFVTNMPDNGPKIFFDIYTENMLRIGAQGKYLFSPHFFETAFQSLEKNLKFWQIYYRGDPCAVWTILTGKDLAYTWLSGSKTQYMNLNPNNMLTHKSILELKKEGFQHLIMGSGKSTSRDSLFDFKEGFSPLKKDFYVYKNVHLPQEYNRLVELQNCKGLGNEEFFPKYRLREEMAGQTSEKEK